MYPYLRKGGKTRTRGPTVRRKESTVLMHMFEREKQRDLRGAPVAPSTFPSCRWATVVEHLN